MKTLLSKKLFAFTVMMMIFSVMNQSVNAQGCLSHPDKCRRGTHCECQITKPYDCRCTSFPGLRIGKTKTKIGQPALADVYPNPVSGTAIINFELEQAGKVSLQ